MRIRPAQARAAFLLTMALAPVAPAQQVTQPNAAPVLPRNFYHDYQLTPIGNGEKLLLTLQAGGQKVDLVVEPVTPKDGGPVTQYVLYANGGITLYTKTTVTLPNPNGGEGTPVEGLSVSLVPTGPTPAAAAPRPAASAVGHQTSSIFTTLSHKDKDFKLPIRMDKPGFGVGRPRIWLLWDGKKEIQVEPVETKFKDSLWAVPVLGGDLNHLKFLSNVYTEGSPAPRYFYLKRNKDDSMTVYGDDDIDKLKAIDKGKGR